MDAQLSFTKMNAARKILQDYDPAQHAFNHLENLNIFCEYTEPSTGNSETLLPEN
jgi:hypothetical protein